MVYLVKMVIFHGYVSHNQMVPILLLGSSDMLPIFFAAKRTRVNSRFSDQARADPTLKDLTQRSAADIAESWRGDAGRNLQNGDSRIWWDFVGYVFMIFHYILIYVCIYMYMYV